jgi:maleylpyruvate isomerase
MTTPSPDLRLYGYWRSGTSHRVRIALHLKGLAFENIPLDLLAGDQRSEAYLAINPQGLAPTLVSGNLRLTQSLAIIEWLEARAPAPPLLPQDVDERAIVHAMALAIACDIHPLNNVRVLQALRQDFAADEGQVRAWIARWINAGFEALEVWIAAHGRGFAYGDQPGLVDCCLAPQVYSAERFGVDLTPYPQLRAAYAAAADLPAFVAAHPDRYAPA